MPVFELTEELFFPPPEYAGEGGLLAVGGDLSAQRLLLAYSMGIFPWYSQGYPLLWWSPDPRLVLLPGELKISRSLRKTVNKGVFAVTMDTAFEEVINRCALVHREQNGETWITPEMVAAYTELHRLGFAHSVESWKDGELAGGLYGVALGGLFCGESMFSIAPDASKTALVVLVEQLGKRGFELIDCQVVTSHLKSLGAKEIPRHEFIALLRHALKKPGWPGKWELATNKK